MLLPIKTLINIVAKIKISFKKIYSISSYNKIFVAAFLFLSSCNEPINNKESNKIDKSLLVLPQPAPVSAAESERIKNSCTRWYDSVLKQSGFNGGMIVAKNGNIIFEQYLGTVHLPGKDSINENTSLHIASTSKTFTAMAVLKLWQEGKLSLDDEFSKYFPQFNYPGVTIRSLLSHRSGLPNYLYFMETLGWDQNKFVTNEDVLNYLITRKAELADITSPNTHFTYCNTNYALLALLIEKITGKKFPDFLMTTFFKPLQMKNTFVYSLTDTSTVMPSYDWRGRNIPINFLDKVYGDKNVYTTPRDLLIWDRALTSGKIFSSETLLQAYTPYSNEKRGIRNYGLGWRMNIYPTGKKMIYHNGWWHGSNATFIRLLQDSATIILIGNKFTRSIYHAKILANIFGEYFDNGDEDEMDILKLPDSLSTEKLIANNLPLTGSIKNDSLKTGSSKTKKTTPVLHHRTKKKKRK